MNKKLIIGCFVAIVGLFILRGLVVQEQLLPDFHPPKAQIVDLDNGLRLYLVEDHELPTFSIGIILPVGSIHDPLDKAGLASLTMRALRAGGTQNHSPEKIDQMLEDVSATINASMSHEFGTLSGNSLKTDVPLLLDLMFDLLKNPQFDAKELSLIKKRLEASLDRQNEDPMQIATREFPKLIYGSDSPWAKTMTHDSLKKISRQDCQQFYRNTMSPQNMVIAISGDFDPNEMIAQIQHYTEDWQPLTQPLPEIPEAIQDWSPQNLVLTKDFSQSALVLGHWGAKRSNPDKYPLAIMNFILGGSGSISSRLGLEIRTRLGLAYATWSRMGIGKTYGVFQATALTQNQNTAQVDQKMRELISAMQHDPQVTDQELNQAKKTILRTLIFEYESRYDYAYSLARYHYLGYPPNYLDTYRQSIEKVTKEDVERVAQKYLHPNSLRLMVIGPKSVLPSLRDLDPKVKVRELH